MLIAIFVVISILFVGLSGTILFLVFNKESIFNENGKVMFEIDYEKRKIRNIDHPALNGSKLPNSQKLWSFYNGKWTNLDKFLAFFDKETNKRYRNAMHDIESGKDDKVNFETKALKSYYKKKTTRRRSWKGKKNYWMETTLFKCDKSYIGGEIKFSLPVPQGLTKFPDRIQSSLVIKIKSKFIGFWVFNMRDVTAETKNAFFSQMKRAIRVSDMKYFLYENKLVLVMPTSSLIALKKKIQKRRPNVDRVINKKGNKKYFNYSGILYTNPIKSPKKNKELLIKLDYLIWKSLKLNTKSTFVDEDLQTFQKFKHAYITIEQSIKAQSMKTIEVKVKKYNNKRSIIKYVFPDVEDTPPRFAAMVLTNDVMRIRMMNSHAEKIMADKKANPGIMDVNAEWLITNAENIKNKKIIYMVEYDDDTSQKLIFAIIMQLQEKGILCGIKINKADVKSMTALSRVAPKFIVIDRELSKIAHKTEMYVKLSSIREVAIKTGTKIIYELPSQKLDSKQREVIGLEFYYDYK